MHLTGKEYAILELLTLRKGMVLTKEVFLNHLYGGMDEPEVKIIDVFICKLRKKLAQAGRQPDRHRLGPRLRAAGPEPAVPLRKVRPATHRGARVPDPAERRGRRLPPALRPMHRAGGRRTGGRRAPGRTASAGQRRLAPAGIDAALAGHRHQPVGQAQHGFGPAQIEHPVRRHLRGEPSSTRPWSAVEVDQHVAAEDDVEAAEPRRSPSRFRARSGPSRAALRDPPAPSSWRKYLTSSCAGRPRCTSNWV